MSSPFMTVRYPNGACELTYSKIPKVGDTLRRSGGKWLVAAVVVSKSGPALSRFVTFVNKAAHF